MGKFLNFFFLKTFFFLFFRALFEKDNEPRHFIRSRQRARFSLSASPTSNALLGNFEVCFPSVFVFGNLF